MRSRDLKPSSARRAPAPRTRPVLAGSALLVGASLWLMAGGVDAQSIGPGGTGSSGARGVAAPVGGTGAVPIRGTGAPSVGRIGSAVQPMAPGVSRGTGLPDAGGLQSPVPQPGGLNSTYPAGLPQTQPYPSGLPSPSPYPGGAPSAVVPGGGIGIVPNTGPTGATVVLPDGSTTPAVPNTSILTPSGAVVPMPAATPGVPAGPVSGVGARRVVTGGRDTMAQVEQGFRFADTDGDGQLSRTETQSTAFPPLGFDDMDTDKDGRVSRGEWLRAAGG